MTFAAHQSLAEPDRASLIEAQVVAAPCSASSTAPVGDFPQRLAAVDRCRFMGGCISFFACMGEFARRAIPAA